MKSIEIKVPDDLGMNEYDFTMIIASKLYAEAKLTAGQAAELVGLTKRAFIEILGKYGVSVLSTSISDLHADIANA